MRFFPLFALAFLQFEPLSGQDSLQFTLNTAFDEPFVYGTRPDFRGFSIDGKSLFMAWNDSSYSKTSFFKIDLKTGVTSAVEPDTDLSLNLSADRKRRVYSKEGDLWVTDVTTGASRKVVKSPVRESGARFSPDAKKLAYQSEGNVWVVDLDAGGIVQITAKSTDEPSWSVSAWSADGSYLILTQTDSGNQQDVYFPEYAGKMVVPGKSRRGISSASVWVAYVDSTKPKKIFEGSVWIQSLSTSPDGKTVYADVLSPDMKLRDIFRFNPAGAPVAPLFHDSTAGWINSGYALSAFAPKASRFVFASEKDGWNHLYLSENGSFPIQLTSGSWETVWWNWVDDQTIVFLSNEEDPGSYHLYLLDIQKKSRLKLTTGDAYRYDPALSPDRKMVVYMRSGWNEPGELYTFDLKEKKEIKRSSSIPQAFKKYRWLKPDYIRFTGRDSTTKISMTVVENKAVAPGSKKPVVVFVHGAGSLQNVYQGWSDSYYREYVFHQFLAQEGYVVVEVDYRHSLGYGRKFREDVTGWLGRYELQDIEDGLKVLSRGETADLSRVGIYGGSYGGFMALYAVTHAPETFHSAAALRAVTNWENYYNANPWYTLPRLGKPDLQAENYRRSSPLYHVSKLSRPVLVLHGLIDNNVGFQDAAQYIEKLVQMRKQPFELMIYPTERHSFQDADAWYDEYARIFRFFEQTVKTRKP